MNRKFYFFIIIILILYPFSSFTQEEPDISELYESLIPQNPKPTYELFCYGMKGLTYMKKKGFIKNSRHLTLIDFSISSKKKRLWIIDIENKRVLFHTLVTHGQKSGYIFPKKFSNHPYSNMSSIGFYITGSTFWGKHGHSLYLDGAEKGINNNSRKRAISLHGAYYATKRFIKKYKRLGRSFGCLCIPPEEVKKIVATIKDKSCLFIFYPDNKYLQKTKFLHD